MMNYLTTVFSERKWYWQLRRLKYRLFFKANNYVLGLKNKGIEEYETSKYFRAIMPDTLPQLFLAFATAVILQIINVYFSQFYSILGWMELDKGVYATFFATVASIGAVFIGLYYTALTTIAASTFAKTPSGVRGLLSREQVGNVYIRFLAYLTSLSIFLLTFRLLNYQEILISVPIVSFLSCFGVVAFVKLGQRIFSFFDPIQLSGHIYRQFQEALSIAHSNNSNAFDPSFQNHSQIKARRALNAISDLISICKSEPHLQKNSLTSLSALVFSLFEGYQFIKNKIPSKSLWFQQDTKFEQIYRQSDSKIQMSQQTSQFNASTTEANHWWVEDKILEQLYIILNFNLINENAQAVESFLRSLEDILGRLSSAGEAAKAAEIYSQIINHCVPHFEKIVNRRLKLILSESLARIPIVILLEFRSYASEIKNHDWDEILSNIDWKNKRSIYKINAPQHLLSTLEDLSNRLNFEAEMGHQLVTPVWYTKEIIFRKLSEKLAIDFKIIYNPAKGEIGDLFKKLNDEDDPIQISLIISVFKEFLHKLKAHQKSFEIAFDFLTSNKKIIGLKWSTLDPSEAQKSVEEMSMVVTKKTAELSGNLLNQVFDETLPDFAGRFLHETGESLLESLLTNNGDLFAELFENYFRSCMLMFEKLRPNSDIPAFRLNYEVRISLGPLADLIDLSGYAMFFSELYETEIYANRVKTTWDSFLSKDLESYASREKIIEITLSMNRNSMSEPHRGILRMGWAEQVYRIIRGRFGVDSSRFEYSSRKIHIDHPSPLVRVLATSSRINNYNGIDIFNALYFLKEVNEDDYSNDLKSKIEKESKK